MMLGVVLKDITVLHDVIPKENSSFEQQRRYLDFRNNTGAIVQQIGRATPVGNRKSADQILDDVAALQITVGNMTPAFS